MADALNFAYWVPNVSGGLVVSNIDQRTDHSPDYNIDVARTAEQVGFDYALTQVRYLASYGADAQHESVSFSLALLHPHGATQGHRGRPPRPVAGAHPRQARRDGAGDDEQPPGAQHRLRLVQAGVHPPRPRLARPRGALPTGRGVHRGPARPVAGGGLHLSRRLLPHPRRHLPPAADDPARDLPGWQLHGSAGDGRTPVRLVLHERQDRRGRRRAGPNRA